MHHRDEPPIYDARSLQSARGNTREDMTQLQRGDEPTQGSSPCPKCGAQLRLVRIVPDRAQHEVHTAKCDACGEEVSSVVRID